MSINVTSLTKGRLLETLAEAKKIDASVIVLQETRHLMRNLGWAKSICRDAGFGAAFSIPPPGTAKWIVSHGGVAVCWKRSMGRIAVHDMKTPTARVLGCK